MTGRLYYAPGAMWNLRWFLRDFGHDAELSERNEIDEKALVDRKCQRKYTVDRFSG